MVTKKSRTVFVVPVLLAAMILLFGFTACSGEETKTSTPSSKVEFLGTWERVTSDGLETIQMTADGKYITDIRLNNGTTTHNENTWDYEDGTFTVHYSALGLDSSYDARIMGDILFLDNGNAKLSYTKK